MALNQVEAFLKAWEHETQGTLKLLRSLPEGQYDFRPDAGGRSLGELAWHLAEVEGLISFAVERGKFDLTEKVPNLERPKAIDQLAPRFEAVHQDAVARVKKLKPEDLDREMPFLTRTITLRDALWSALLIHEIHHRGQLTLMVRLAGGKAPGLHGPNREDMAALRAARG